MRRTIRALVVIGVVLTLVGGHPASAGAADGRLAPRVQVDTPWTKDDTVGDASRPQGDVRRIVVDNGRQNITLTFRMVAAPIWDTLATDRATVMRFLLDWRGTTAAFDRRVTVSWSDGDWRIVVFNGAGGAVCVRDGGVQPLANHRYRFTVAVGMCMGGAHLVRVAASFSDDQDDSAADDIRLDRVPNSGGYGPFIRLP